MYIVYTIAPTEDGIEHNEYQFKTLEECNAFMATLEEREEVYEIWVF